MKLTSENAFVGASITGSDGVKLIVYKVNEKSFYAGVYPLEQYKEMFKNRDRGATFKMFCTKNNINMYSYDGWEIDEAEASKKEIAAATVKSHVSLKPEIRKAIKDYYEECMKKGESLRLSAIWYRGDVIRIIVSNKDSLVLSIDGIRYLYHVPSEETITLGDDEALTEATVPWEKLLTRAA